MADAIESRYARALFAVVRSQQGESAAAVEQLRSFEATFAGSRVLREVLMNPSLPQEQKLAVLDGIAERIGMGRPVRNFLAVIMDHQRLHTLKEMIQEFALVSDEGTGLTEVTITTARQIGDEERRELEAKATELAGGGIRASYAEDPALLGGAVLKIGSTVYDGSLRARLTALKQSMSEARIA